MWTCLFFAYTLFFSSNLSERTAKTPDNAVLETSISRNINFLPKLKGGTSHLIVDRSFLRQAPKREVLFLQKQWECQLSLPSGILRPSLIITSRCVLPENGNLFNVVDRKTGTILWPQSSPNVALDFMNARVVGCSYDNIALIDTGNAWTGVDMLKAAVTWTLPKQQASQRLHLFSNVFGDVFAVAAPNDSTARLFDIHSGRHLDPSNVTDSTLLKQSAVKYGESLAPVSYQNGPTLLNLLTGRLSPIPGLQHLSEHVFPIVYTDHQIICYRNTDTDAAGGSGWPKYTVSYDINGRRLWQFPTHLTLDSNSNGIGASYQESTVWIPGTKTLLVSSKDGLYGIDSRNGRQLWHQRKWTWQTDHVVPYRGGAFLVTGATSNSYISALTGRHQPFDKLRGLSLQQTIVSDGTQLFTVDDRNVIKAYGISIKDDIDHHK